MFIREVGANSSVSVRASRGLKTLQFETKSIKSLEEGLVVNRIRYCGKVVNFENTPGIIYTVTAVSMKDNKVYRWGSVAIHKILIEEEEYLLLTCNQEAKATNRRDSYRVFLGTKGMIQPGPNHSAFDVTIKDISENGLAFIHNKDIDISNCGMVHVTFQDETWNQNFDLNCVIVRKQPLEERFIYGCQLIGGSNTIGRYMALKQRERLSGGRIQRA